MEKWESTLEIHGMLFRDLAGNPASYTQKEHFHMRQIALNMLKLGTCMTFYMFLSPPLPYSQASHVTGKLCTHRRRQALKQWSCIEDWPASANHCTVAFSSHLNLPSNDSNVSTDNLNIIINLPNVHWLHDKNSEAWMWQNGHKTRIAYISLRITMSMVGLFHFKSWGLNFYFIFFFVNLNACTI